LEIHVQSLQAPKKIKDLDLKGYIYVSHEKVSIDKLKISNKREFIYFLKKKICVKGLQ